MRARSGSEVREVRDIARRIAAILLLEPALNEAYAAAKADVWEWTPADPRATQRAEPR